MLEELFIHNLWLTILVWLVLYGSDYYLTILSARIYDAKATQHIRFQGSLELTPYFQKDIDARHTFSLRWAAAFALSTGCMVVLWFLAVDEMKVPQLYAFSVGSLFLGSIVADMRHVQNILLFSYLTHSPPTQTPSEYPRWLTLRLSGVSRLLFCLLFAFLAAVTNSWFILGGSAKCGVVAFKQWRLSHHTMRAETEL